MRQRTIAEFTAGPHDLQCLCEENPSRRLLGELEIVDPSPFEAETTELFKTLFRSRHNRLPNAAEWKRYFGLHPDQFAEKFGRSWEKVQAEVEKMLRAAEKKREKLEKRAAKAEEVELDG